MLNRDFTKTSLSLIKEKIIKTDTVLNIVCEKNALISELQSKLDIVSGKYKEKIEEFNSTNEQLDLKNKECYKLSSKLVKLQEQHDQLAFDANYAYSEYSKLSNDRYITIQNLESELIKLNARYNKLQKDNDLKLSSPTINTSEKEQESGKLKATVKDFKSKLKSLQEELNESKYLHNNCLKDLITTKDECKRLELVYNNYKSNNKRVTNGKCATCTYTENIESTLYKSSSDVQKEKYQKLLCQYEELLVKVDKLKNANIKVAEKYSAIVFQSQSAKEHVNNSSQTTEDESKEKIIKTPEKIAKGIDINEKAVQIRQLNSEMTCLKQKTTKIVNEKRVLQTDLKCLSQENTLFRNKYEEIKLERDSLLLENQIKSIGVSVETQTDNNLNLDEVIMDDTIFKNDFLVSGDDFCGTIDGIGLDLSSSDSESEKELSSCDDILEEMVKFRQLLSPFPQSPKHSRDSYSCRNNIEVHPDLIPDTIDQTETLSDYLEVQKNELLLSCVKFNTQIEGQVNLECRKMVLNDSTQTDLVEIQENQSYLSTIHFGCQTFNILTEERGIQCSYEQKTVSTGCQVDILTEKVLKGSIDKMEKLQAFVKMDEYVIENISQQIINSKLSPRQRKYQKDNKTLKKALRIIKQANYDVVITKGKIKEIHKRGNYKKAANIPRGNLKLALEVFRKYSMTMSFEKGDLTKMDNKSTVQITAVNSCLFGKSNRMLRRFCKKFRDLKNAMNVANKRRLSAVIVNGVICDKMLEKCEKVDKEIDQLVKISNLWDAQKFAAILDEDKNLIAFDDENDVQNLKLTENEKGVNHNGNNLRQNTSLSKKTLITKRKLCKRMKKKDRIKKVQRLNDLRIKFELIIEEGRKLNFFDVLSLQKSPCDVGIQKGKISFASIRNDLKDIASEGDSGYTEGSEISESTKEIENTSPRNLRSSLKRKRSVSSSSQKPTLNKTRKITSKDLFGSDDSDSSENANINEEVSVLQKQPRKNKKASVFDKMKKVIRTYNPRARTDSNLNQTSESCKQKSSVIIQENDSKELKNKTFECGKVEIKCKLKKSEHNRVKKIATESIKNPSEPSHINVENKEHLMQRFISDIPIIKPIRKVAERTTFKKPLARRRRMSTEMNVIKNVIEAEMKDNIGDVVEVDQSIQNTTSEENDGEDGEISSDEEVESIQNEISDDVGLKLLNKLIQNNCEESIVSTVQEQISHASSEQISRIMIYFIYKYRSETAEPSHTPLAPSMSPTYKTLIGFANRLIQEKHGTLFSDLLDQLEAKFLLHVNVRINNTNATRVGGVTIFSLEQVFRVYVSICMLRTEVLRLRRFLCDMAYYQRDGFYGLLYAVFTIWPTVLPKKMDENEEPREILKENDGLLMAVLMLFVFKKRNSDEYIHYRPFLTTFAFGFYKYQADDLHLKLIFDKLINKFTTSDSDVLAYALIILLQRITNVELLHLLRSESFNNVFKASDKEKLIAKSKLLWLLDRIIPEIKKRGDRTMLKSLEYILKNLEMRVENEKVKNFIATCIGKLSK